MFIATSSKDLNNSTTVIHFSGTDFVDDLRKGPNRKTINVGLWGRPSKGFFKYTSSGNSKVVVT